MRVRPPFQSRFHSAGMTVMSNGTSFLSIPCTLDTSTRAKDTGASASERRCSSAAAAFRGDVNFQSARVHSAKLRRAPVTTSSDRPFASKNSIAAAARPVSAHFT